MTKSFKDSFSRIGGVIVQEYNEHGQLRGISTELVNDAFDAGEKLGDIVRRYAPQAVDTAKIQGENAASTAKTQGEKAVKAAKDYSGKAFDKVKQYSGNVAEQAKDAISKAGDRFEDEVSSDESEPSVDASWRDDGETDTGDADANADATSEAGEEPDAGRPAVAEPDGNSGVEENQSYRISPDDAGEAIRRIDEQLKAKRADLEAVCTQITYEQSKDDPDEKTLVDLENKRSTIQSNIDYMEESKRVFKENTSAEPNK